MSRPIPKSAPSNEGQRRLQEVLHCLDGVNGGTERIAWYGQNRARGMDHDEALEQTIVEYRLRSQPWWSVRFPEGR